MSLSTQAKAAEQERRQQERDRAERWREEAAAKARDAVVRKLSDDQEKFEVEYLDTVRVDYPYRCTGSFNPRAGQIGWSSRDIHRFLVDDVVVRVWHDAKYGANKVSPEVSCKECGRQTSPEEAGGHVPYTRNLVEAVGQALGGEWTCAHCTVEVPEHCPTCGRSNR